MTEFEFNPFDLETRRNPAAIYARARREHPVYRHPGLPIVSVFRYADVQNILRDAEILEIARSEAAAFIGSPPSEEELLRAVAYLRDHWQRRYGLVMVA